MGNSILKWIISHCKMGKSSFLWYFSQGRTEHGKFISHCIAIRPCIVILAYTHLQKATFSSNTKPGISIMFKNLDRQWVC